MTRHASTTVRNGSGERSRRVVTPEPGRVSTSTAHAGSNVAHMPAATIWLSDGSPVAWIDPSVLAPICEQAFSAWVRRQ